jgi:hypothetical protein
VIKLNGFHCILFLNENVFDFLVLFVTCVDQILVGQSGMIDVVNGGREQSRSDLQRSENRLKNREEIVTHLIKEEEV